MKPIYRGKGTTESERYLARLADATFLDLWSYPNTFIDKRSAPGAEGKELADLLVVCGDDVIIFSDKSIAWPPGEDVNLSWSRWYRRAVKKSVDQIRGAERWLRDYPERIFVDPACIEHLPIELPPLERRRVHGIAVALGAQQACSAHFGGSDGALMIYSALKGDQHVDHTIQGHTPFAFGDVDPSGPFVHVFDETALDLVLGELDTVSDFVRYLLQRSTAIRSGTILHAPSEADMLALYIQSAGDDGEPSFPQQEYYLTTPNQYLVPEGEFAALVTRPAYLRQKKADKPSYIWDRLIGLFTKNIIAGTSVAIGGAEPDVALAEPALRIMARENRLMRRGLGSALFGALQEAERLAQSRFARVILPQNGGYDPEVGYVFLVLAYPTDYELKDGYAQYRRARVSMLEAYCASTLYDNRRFKRIVGIAVDASSRETDRQGASEDLVAVEITEWTPELERSVEEQRRFYDVLDSSRLRAGRYTDADFRQERGPVLSRQQRRAREREMAKRQNSSPKSGRRRDR